MGNFSVFHCHMSVVQRSRRNSAGKRLAYQMCLTHHDPVWGWSDYTTRRREHAGSAILLPSDTPESLMNVERFRFALTAREKRIDGQEGFTIDFGLPRAIPQEQWLRLAAFVLGPFIDEGMAAQIDIHCPKASDGFSQPHCHALLSQRVMGDNGFGRKNPNWALMMRHRNGQQVRALIAGRLTLACQLLGLDVRLDPRAARITGDLEPEQRVDRRHWVAARKQKQVPVLDELNQTRRAQRTARQQLSARDHEKQMLADELPSDVLEKSNLRTLSPAFTRPVAVDTKAAIRDFTFATNRAEPGEFDDVVFDDIGGDPVFWLRGSAIRFDGWALSLSGPLNERAVDVMVAVAVLMKWPALVIEGDMKFQRAMSDASIAHPALPTLIKGELGPRARKCFKQHGETYLQRIIEKIDPLGTIRRNSPAARPSLVIQPAPRPDALAARNLLEMQETLLLSIAEGSGQDQKRPPLYEADPVPMPAPRPRPAKMQ